jgi:hypothetical protein
MHDINNDDGLVTARLFDAHWLAARAKRAEGPFPLTAPRPDSRPCWPVLLLLSIYRVWALGSALVSFFMLLTVLLYVSLCDLLTERSAI